LPPTQIRPSGPEARLRTTVFCPVGTSRHVAPSYSSTPMVLATYRTPLASSAKAQFWLEAW